MHVFAGLSAGRVPGSLRHSAEVSTLKEPWTTVAEPHGRRSLARSATTETNSAEGGELADAIPASWLEANRGYDVTNGIRMLPPRSTLALRAPRPTTGRTIERSAGVYTHFGFLDLSTPLLDRLGFLA